MPSQKLWTHLFLGLGLVFLVHCSTDLRPQGNRPDKITDQIRSPTGRASGGCTDGRKAYSESVHKYIRSEGKCLRCHDSKGPGPDFAVENLDLSYLRLKSRVQWSNPESSLFVQRGGEDHCNCGATQALLTGLLTEWWRNGESICKEAGHFVSDSVAIPQLGDVGSGWAKMRVGLGTTNPLLQGSFLDFEIENFADEIEGSKGAYRIRKPRLSNGSNEVELKGLGVLLNGYVEPNSLLYSEISIRGSIGSTAAFSTKTLILLKDRPGQDTISISFNSVDPVKSLDCMAPDTFHKKVEPILENRNCYFCHGGGPDQVVGQKSAKLALSMAQNSARLCKEIKLRSPESESEQPLFWAFPQKGQFNHPIFNFIESERSSYIEWLREESERSL